MSIEGQIRLEKIDDEELLAILQAKKQFRDLVFSPEKMMTHAERSIPRQNIYSPRSYGNVILSWTTGDGLGAALCVLAALSDIQTARTGKGPR